MAAPFDNIVQHLFHQPSLHSVTVDELEQMTLQHPYFAAAQFLLLKKMQDTDHPSFTDQLHRTALHFNNPLWLQFLLQPETASDITIDKVPFIEHGPRQPDFQVAEEKNEAASHEFAEANDMVADDKRERRSDKKDIKEEQQHANGYGSMMDVITAVFNEPEAIEDHNATAQQDEPANAINEANRGEEINPAAPEPTRAAQEAQAPFAHIDDNDVNIERAEHIGYVHEEEVVGTSLVNREVPEQAPSHDDETHVPVQDSATADETPFGEQVEGTAANDKAGKVDEQEKIVATEPAALSGAEEHDATEMPVASVEDSTSLQVAPAGESSFLKTIIETPAAKNDLLFEPYHTVDYFASQGIKLGKQESEPKDKLGKQLKSFTDWLKTMKKLPQVSIDKILAENEESKVVEDAIHSIENKEVITEAMAEVFEKQGMYDKAGEIYQKLSLLNPSKSAYFAAKIEALKH